MKGPGFGVQCVSCLQSGVPTRGQRITQGQKEIPIMLLKVLLLRKETGLAQWIESQPVD